MQTIHFSIVVNAGKEKAWHTMLDDATYRKWTKAFHEGSYYEGSWEKGSKIRFIALSGDGKEEGMYSRIKENDTYRFLSIEHIGIIADGIVNTTSEEVKKWAPSFENYTFTPVGNQTEIAVDMQIVDDYKAMFEDMWPKALSALKTLCEK